MKFYDPYSTFHPKTRQHNRFRKGIPFPYPVGGAWNKLTKLGQGKELNQNQMPSIMESEINMLESMQRRLNKVHRDIDKRLEDQVDHVLSIVVDNESETRKLTKEKIKKHKADGKNQDRMINARVYAAQIIAENATSAAKEAPSDNGGDTAEPVR